MGLIAASLGRFIIGFVIGGLIGYFGSNGSFKMSVFCAVFIGIMSAVSINI